MVAPKKSLGQNFLRSQEHIQAIASAISMQGRSIIEVGPGEGDLTRELLRKQPESLTLIELDTRLIAPLKRNFPQTIIHHMDVLEFHDVPASYSVIANIPYYITSPILSHFLWKVEHRPEFLVILMQKEVAEKITCTGEHPSYLSLSLGQACTSITIGGYVGREHFYPVPKVDSAFVIFQTHPKNPDEQEYIRLFSLCFAQPRKTLVSNLIVSEICQRGEIEGFLQELKIPLSIRPHELTLEQWGVLKQRLDNLNM